MTLVGLILVVMIMVGAAIVSWLSIFFTRRQNLSHLGRLQQKLDLKNKELQGWMNYATQQSRVQSLGEMTALVAHDLSGPIHSAQMLLHELKEDPQAVIAHPELIDKTALTVSRCVELVHSLKNELKGMGHRHSKATSAFLDVYYYTVNVLDAQFRDLTSSPSIQFVLQFDDSSVKDVELAMARLDAIHVLHNLMSNAVRELKDCKTEQPYILTRLRIINSENIEIRIIDNGRGLSPERYESMTSDSSLFKGYYLSVGLRLTRRLVESLGGQMQVEWHNAIQQSGTAVVLNLKGKAVFAEAPAGKESAKEIRAEKYEEKNLDLGR